MKMNEVMKVTDLTKQAIIYYEKEGLLEAKRTENNYRDYSDKDVQTLLWIKCMRAMQVSIEDIKRLQNGEYSMEECLEKQVKMMEENMKTLQQTQQQIQLFKDKNMPIIPELLALDMVVENNSLGFKKTTANVSIGRPLTKAHALKQILHWILYSIALSLALMAGWAKWATSFSKVPNFFVLFICFLMMFIIFYGLGLGNLKGTYHFINNPLLFMEFNQTGIVYSDANTFGKRMSYLWNVLFGKQTLKEVTYENISSCKIVCHYMMTSVQGIYGAGYIGKAWDFYFTFKDGTEYALIRPMILNNEIEAIKIILENKVSNYQYVEKKH